MTTYTLAGVYGWAGGGKEGAVVDIWATSRFAGIPAYNQAPPAGNPDAGPVTTGPEFGSPGGYEILGITVLQDYYVRVQYGGVTMWSLRTAASLGGVGGGGDVLTVFGRTGNVVGQSGDYTAAQVGADDAGAAATAQANAQTFATSAANAAQAAAEAASVPVGDLPISITNGGTGASTASAARTALGLGSAATQPSSAFDAAGAAAAAAAASLPLVGGTMTGAIAMGSHPITGITDLSMAGLSGATAATRYVGGTTSGHPSSGTFAVGDYVIAQNGVMWICTTAGTPGSWVTWGAAATLFGGNPIAGTYTAGQPLLFQGGAAGSTATAGNFSFGFPSTFTNSLISLTMVATDLGQSNVVMVNNPSSTLSVAAGQYWQNGSALTGAMSVNYLAVGS